MIGEKAGRGGTNRHLGVTKLLHAFQWANFVCDVSPPSIVSKQGNSNKEMWEFS